jgi:hypothetical protein
MNWTISTRWTAAPTPRPDCQQIASMADGTHDLIAVRAGIQGGHDIER